MKTFLALLLTTFVAGAQLPVGIGLMTNQFVATTSSTNDITNDLVMHWDYESGSGTNVLDASGNGHNGIPSGGYMWTNGVVGTYAMYFDGTGNVDGGDVVGADGVATLTFCAWLKLATNTTQIILSKDHSGSGSWELSWNSGSRAFASRIFTTTGNATATTGAYPSGSHPGIDGLWHHVSVVYNGAYITFYVDGAIEGTPEALTGTIQDMADSVVNGSRADDAVYTTGTIDDFRVYSRALTATEISMIYALGSP